jgi:hypothetical protein
MRKDVPTGRSCCVSALRQELIARNSSYASLNLLPHVTSNGELPVVVCEQSECGRNHGNFIAASYRAILRTPEWRKRLQKVHSQGRRSLPARDGSWRELDSSLSSDALLMNIFWRDTAKGILQNPGPRTRKRPRIWIHASRSVTQRSNRADRN